jgi:20S proteasome alpha/beta subunit
MAGEAEQQLRAYVEYLRDIGVHDFYRQGEPVFPEVAVDAAAPVAQGTVAQPLPVEATVVGEDIEEIFDCEAGEFR